MRKFRPGLKYVFTTKNFKRACKKIGLPYRQLNWYKLCNGMEVNVINSSRGMVGVCSVAPEWCKVVK